MLVARCTLSWIFTVACYNELKRRKMFKCVIKSKRIIYVYRRRKLDSYRQLRIVKHLLSVRFQFGIIRWRKSKMVWSRVPSRSKYEYIVKKKVHFISKLGLRLVAGLRQIFETQQYKADRKLKKYRKTIKTH